MQLAGLRLLAAAVIPVQAAMRQFLARREKLNRLWAVIVIQSYMRRWICERRLKKTVDYVVAIQKVFRGWLARDRVEDQHYCATQIQRVARGYIATLAVYEDIYKVTLIQSYVRMKLAVEDAIYRMALIIQVQSIIRGYLVRKRMDEVTRAATVVQTAWRGYYDYTSYQYDLLDVKLVQCLVRRRAATIFVANERRLRAQRHKELMDRSATIIQAQWRSYDCTMNYLHYLADVLIVQNAVRRWHAAKLVSTYRHERDEAAAVKIQRTWRGFVCYADYMFTVSDIVTMQSCARRWLALTNYGQMKEARNQAAAEMIQRNWRGSVGRNEALMKQVEIIICQVSSAC